MKTISEYRRDPLEEEAEIVPYNELHVVVLGTGDGDGTFADIVEEVSVKRDIKFDFVDITKSWIADSDIDIGTVKLRNIDGKNKDIGNQIDPKTAAEYLELYVRFKRKVIQAEVEGRDTLESFKNEFNNYFVKQDSKELNKHITALSNLSSNETKIIYFWNW